MFNNRLCKIMPHFKQISNMVYNYAIENKFLYYGVGILLDGKVVYTECNGNMDIKNNIPFSIDTVIKIGSLTKNITAICIFKLRDIGLLNLDDPIYKYIPNFKIKKYKKDSQDITIRHLLNMKSGIYTDDESVFNDNNILSTAINVFSSPGTDYIYANISFDLLGIIITNITGMSYQLYIQLYILNPLQMNNTTFDINKVDPKNINKQYTIDLNNNIIQFDNMNKQHNEGAGNGLFSNMRDWFKFVAFHQYAYPSRDDIDNNILKRSSIRELHNSCDFAKIYIPDNPLENRTIDFYSNGLYSLMDLNSRKYIGHNGIFFSNSASWLISPKHGLGIIIFNSNSYKHVIHKLPYFDAKILNTLIDNSNLNEI